MNQRRTGNSIAEAAISPQNAPEVPRTRDLQLTAAMVESCEDAILALGLSGDILSWNHGAEFIFGYPAEEAIGKHFHFLIWSENRAEIDLRLRQVSEGKVLRLLQSLGVSKSGKLITLSITWWPIKTAQGEITATSLTIRDVTGLRGDEEAQALAASIVDSSDDGISSTTLDGTILSWNRAAERMAGYTSHEIIGKNVAILAQPDRLERLPKILEAVRSGLSIGPVDVVLRAKTDERSIHRSLYFRSAMLQEA